MTFRLTLLPNESFFFNIYPLGTICFKGGEKQTYTGIKYMSRNLLQKSSNTFLKTFNLNPLYFICFPVCKELP